MEKKFTFLISLLILITSCRSPSTIPIDKSVKTSVKNNLFNIKSTGDNYLYIPPNPYGGYSIAGYSSIELNNFELKYNGYGPQESGYNPDGSPHYIKSYDPVHTDPNSYNQVTVNTPGAFFAFSLSKINKDISLDYSIYTSVGSFSSDGTLGVSSIKEGDSVTIPLNGTFNSYLSNSGYVMSGSLTLTVSNGRLDLSGDMSGDIPNFSFGGIGYHVHVYDIKFFMPVQMLGLTLKASPNRFSNLGGETTKLTTTTLTSSVWDIYVNVPLLGGDQKIGTTGALSGQSADIEWNGWIGTSQLANGLYNAKACIEGSKDICSNTVDITIDNTVALPTPTVTATPSINTPPSVDPTTNPSTSPTATSTPIDIHPSSSVGPSVNPSNPGPSTSPSNPGPTSTPTVTPSPSPSDGAGDNQCYEDFVKLKDAGEIEYLDEATEQQ
jgi:hypothetical protein